VVDGLITKKGTAMQTAILAAAVTLACALISALVAMLTVRSQLPLHRAKLVYERRLEAYRTLYAALHDLLIRIEMRLPREDGAPPRGIGPKYIGDLSDVATTATRAGHEVLLLLPREAERQLEALSAALLPTIYDYLYDYDDADAEERDAMRDRATARLREAAGLCEGVKESLRALTDQAS